MPRLPWGDQNKVSSREQLDGERPSSHLQSTKNQSYGYMYTYISLPRHLPPNQTIIARMNLLIQPNVHMLKKSIKKCTLPSQPAKDLGYHVVEP